MLIPTISPETIAELCATQYSADADSFMPRSLDFPYGITYEFVTDFQAYMDFRLAPTTHPIRVQRQMWTPFFGIAHANWYTQHIADQELLDRVFKCFDQSKKLYVEMLKTGLAYEAQYAVLKGFSGRFMVSGNLGGILSLVRPINTSMYSESTQDLVSDLKQDGYIDGSDNPLTKII